MASVREKGIKHVEQHIVPVADATPHVKVLVYGRNGKGKTRFAATAPKPIILDVNEEGTSSVRNYPDAHVYRIKKWEQLTWAYWYLREGNHEFESVVIDTLTQAQKLCMSAVLRRAEDRDPNRPPSMPRRQDWGQMTEMMKPVIFDFRNLPMNVIFVCQERVDKGGEDDEDATNRFVPDLSPGVRGDAMSAVGIMGRVYKKGVRKGKGKKTTTVFETRMLVGDHDDYETKDRTGQLGYIVRNPTVPQMIEANKHTPEEE
jgi:phage nucleotide-binding protein